MDLLERQYPTQLPSNPMEATISDGFGMLGMFDIISTQSEDASTSINYSFQNPRKVPQEILVPYEPTIPLMPPHKSYIPGMTLTITDALARKASPNVCPQLGNLCKDHPLLVFGSMEDQQIFKKKMSQKTSKKVIPSLEDAIFLGCPQDLVMEELHQELEYQAMQRHTNHLYHGGCLSYIPINTSSVAGVLLYPSGAAMDILTVLTFGPILDDSQIRFSPKPENKIERFQLSGVIRQIESFNYPRSGQSYSIVRTDYMCLLFKVSVIDDENTTKVEMIERKDTQHRIMSAALSPFLAKEYIYTTEKKKLILSDSTGILHRWKKFPGTKDKTNPLFCHFGAHPREAFVHDQKHAVIYDFRSPPNIFKSLFQLPDPCMPTDQCFCVARQHPTNHFYHYLATQDALMLLDQRFPQHAVLQTYHNVKGMPSYLEISSYDETEDSSIVMVGNHIEKQIHCYIVKDKTESVPVLHSLPWKITPYYEWVELIDGIRISGKPNIWERLEEPLMGFAACQVSLEDMRSWNVIQISGAGDLFCQTFIPPDPEAGPKDQIKNEKSLHLCKLWLEAVSEVQVLPEDAYDEAEIRDPSYSSKSKRGGVAAAKGLKPSRRSTPKKVFPRERCRKRSRLEYHGSCSRCFNVECLFGTREGHGLKNSALKYRKHVTLDSALMSERAKKLYEHWKPLVCEKCCADCVEDMESYGIIRVQMKGFLKSLKLPWQDDLQGVKTFEKRKKESLENNLMSQKATPVKQSPSHNVSTSRVHLDMEGPSTTLVVSEELSQIPMSQCSQVTLFSDDDDEYYMELEENGYYMELEENGSFSLDRKPTSKTKKIKRFSQPDSMGF